MGALFLGLAPRVRAARWHKRSRVARRGAAPRPIATPRPTGEPLRWPGRFSGLSATSSVLQVGRVFIEIGLTFTLFEQVSRLLNTHLP